MDLKPFEEMKERYRAAFWIAVGCVANTFLFGVIAFWMKNSGVIFLKDFSAVSDSLRIFFLMISLGGLLMMPAIYSGLLGPRNSDKPIYMDAQLWPVFIQRLFRASLILCLISEAPSFFGLILFAMTHRITDFLLLAIISVLCFLFYFPRYEQWEYELRKIS